MSRNRRQFSTSRIARLREQNSYEVTIKARINANRVITEDEYDITVTVTNVDEPPEIEGKSLVSFTETARTCRLRPTARPTLRAETATLTLGGTDADSFSFTNGALSFKTSPDFEAQSSYEVTITASDGEEESSLDVTVSVTTRTRRSA